MFPRFTAFRSGDELENENYVLRDFSRAERSEAREQLLPSKSCKFKLH